MTASPLALVRAMRPRQWTKNLAVFAALLFAKNVLLHGQALKAVLAFASFCFVASAIYVVNDWVDREKDKLHPEKALRPIAAGQVTAGPAFALVAVCLCAGGALAWSARPEFATLVAGYVGLQVLYSLALKRLVILDVMVIALGFILRVIGGGIAIGVQVSNWLFLCTLLLAVFLGFAKRRAEVAMLAGEQLGHRENLNEYSLPLLDQMMSIVAASCILAYGLYTVSRETVEHVGSDRLKYTVPFVIYGIFRYLFLIHRKGAGGSPEKVLLSDAPLMAALVLWVGTAAWALYA